MAYRKKTLRSMSPTTRKVARLAGEAESVARRLKNLIPDLQRLELDSQALATAKELNKGYGSIPLKDIEDLTGEGLTPTRGA